MEITSDVELIGVQLSNPQLTPSFSYIWGVV